MAREATCGNMIELELIKIFWALDTITVVLKTGSFSHLVLARSGVGNCLQILFKLFLPEAGVSSSLGIRGLGFWQAPGFRDCIGLVRKRPGYNLVV